MAQCADEAAELRHSGVDIPLAWWAFARARDREDPGARGLGEQALELHRSSGYIAGWELECLHRVAATARRCRSSDDAIALVREGRPAVRAMVAYAAARAATRKRRTHCSATRSPRTPPTTRVIGGRCLRVAVLAETGHEERAARGAGPARAHAARLVNYGSIDHLGAVDHFLALGEPPSATRAALAHARSGVELRERLDNEPWLRRAEALLAELERPGRGVSRQESRRKGRASASPESRCHEIDPGEPVGHREDIP